MHGVMNESLRKFVDDRHVIVYMDDLCVFTTITWPYSDKRQPFTCQPIGVMDVKFRSVDVYLQKKESY